MNAPRGEGHGEDGLRAAVRRKGSFAQSMKAVAWSFFGVRRSSDYERDVGNLNPVHVVIAGVLAVLIFIGVLVGVVRWVVGSGAAA